MSLTQQFIRHAASHWHAYTHHPFVQQIADGTLSTACFQHYLKQDYLYLFHYSRAYALAMYKAENFSQMHTAHQALQVILNEVQLHVDFCRQWGISEAELFALPESGACVAYTRYVLDCGMRGTLAELYAALAPCVIGYAEVGRWISESHLSPPDNPYQAWIDTYRAPEMQQAALDIAAYLDSLCAELPPAQLAQIQHIFTTATRMEINFWQMGLDLA